MGWVCLAHIPLPRERPDSLLSGFTVAHGKEQEHSQQCPEFPLTEGAGEPTVGSHHRGLGLAAGSMELSSSLSCHPSGSWVRRSSTRQLLTSVPEFQKIEKYAKLTWAQCPSG